MYIRTISRKNKDGSKVEYVQLAHNYRDPKSKQARAEVLYSFGRKDQLDMEAIRRLAKSVERFLAKTGDVETQCKLQFPGEDVRFVESRPMGGVFVLKKIWDRLRISECLDKALADRQYTAPIGDAVFAMVANRALAPDSKLAVEDWAAKDVHLELDQPLKVQHLYRAMDFLLENQEAIQKEVFWSTANLLNLEVDLVFFDTTSTYFERDEEDEEGLKRYGHSKDKRKDLPQVVVGLAVTKEGLPIRSWVFPGNTPDVNTVEQIQKEMNDWKLGRVVWAMDRGMTSEENRAILQRGGGNYILGEKLRGSNMSKAVLGSPGRFTTVRDNLEIKEVTAGDGACRRRYVIVRNPKQVKRDQATRERLIRRAEQEIEAIGDLTGKKHTKAACALLSHRSMGKYVRELKSGKLKINKAKITEEEKLDGKYLLSCSDDTLSPEEIALGYKQLLEVERAFRTLKSTLDLRPVYHRKDERIRSHVTLCWLALLLVRLIELETGMTWNQVRRILERLHMGEFFLNNSRILQRTELTQDQNKLLKKLKIKPPPLIKKIDLTS
ncbi:transposase IS4 family protein [Desulfatibacillum aliphaticivorans]|uniref:Transposase IS4 family protein n=1 Tax=Desulfatibacillum aliphaticivorans TaxID=218208 RepID=B8F8U5_DESAL|nr:IS1634 family transposase [Desulfatibacillum aliphaticivorans]ACL01977.1 transposase IS4 family protein [Desulfatibacillum aliphaticivorans]